MADRVLVTGAMGFVGRALCKHLAESGYHVRGAVRGDCQQQANIEYVAIGNLESVSRAEWIDLLDDVKVVIHCAALVHQMNGVANPDTYYRINTAATGVLAEAAAEAGVRRFVFLSTVKVLGEFTEPGRPFGADASPNPQDDYAHSKWLAEQALTAVGERTGMEAVIVRPPLIYGPGVGGNFRSLMRLVQRGVPLPLGAVDNRRSLLALDNLVDVLSLCVRAEQPIAGTYLVSDGADISTRELVCALAHAQGVRPRLLPVPVYWLRFVGRVLGKSAAIDRLCENFQVDIGQTKHILGWEPRHTISSVLEKVQAALTSDHA